MLLLCTEHPGKTKERGKKKSISNKIFAHINCKVSTNSWDRHYTSGHLTPDSCCFQNAQSVWTQCKNAKASKCHVSLCRFHFCEYSGMFPLTSSYLRSLYFTHFPLRPSPGSLRPPVPIARHTAELPITCLFANLISKLIN